MRDQFEEKHDRLCQELNDILASNPSSRDFEEKVSELRANFEAWKKAGTP